ncbi:MAG: methyl-accepting chemotaxis protein [Methylocystaceae bacterium]|nr:methyl-accepting chemotaxis protein [Methylocystaceae bacterium]
MVNWFRNARLLYQINLIALITLLGFVIIGISFMSSERKVSSTQDELSEELAALDAAEDVQYQFLNARRREKDFLIRLDEKYIKQHDDVMALINNRMKLLIGNDLLVNERETLLEINEMLNVYQATFTSVSAGWIEMGLNEKQGLRGSLRKSVHEVETRLKEFKNETLTVTMLMMRRHEKDFLLRIDPKYIGRMDERLAEFSAQLIQSYIPSAAQDEIMKLMRSYHADFKKLAAKRLSIQEEVKTLSKVFAQAEKPFNTFFKSLQDRTHSLDEEMQRTMDQTAISMYAVIVLTVGVVFVISFLVARQITRPIQTLTDAMSQLADGNKNTDIPVTKRKNELGEMGRAVLVFKENMIRGEQLAAEQAVEQERQQKRAQQIIELTQGFEKDSDQVLATVHTAITQMSATSEQMKHGADQLNDRSTAVSGAATEAASNVQTVASASEELAASIREIGSQAANSTQIAGQAVVKAMETNETVQGLSEAAQRIGEVVKLINDIADQTNLLALNATIEAARAGDAGKGFAVVASEVKNLANQTAKATDEISRQIGDVQQSTKDAVEAIDGISTVINQMDEIASTIAAAVEEQMAATQEIARNVEQAASGTDEVTQNIEGVSSLATETEQAANDVNTASAQVESQAETMNRFIHGFLEKIRAV